MLAALATACRPNTVVVVVACASAAAGGVRRGREVGALVAPALGIAGTAGFMAFLWLRTGEPGAWWRVQGEGWNQQVDLGQTLLREAVWMLRSPLADLERFIVVACLAFGAASLLVLARVVRRRGWPEPLLVYTIGVLGLGAAYRVDVLRPRAVLAAFPLFLALGVQMSRRTLAIAVAVGAAALIALPWYYALPFASSSSP